MARYFRDNDGGLYRERDVLEREVFNAGKWWTYWFNTAEVVEIDEAEARVMSAGADLHADPAGVSPLEAAWRRSKT